MSVTSAAPRRAGERPGPPHDAATFRANLPGRDSQPAGNGGELVASLGLSGPGPWMGCPNLSALLRAQSALDRSPVSHCAGVFVQNRDGGLCQGEFPARREVF